MFATLFISFLRISAAWAPLIAERVRPSKVAGRRAAVFDETDLRNSGLSWAKPSTQGYGGDPMAVSIRAYASGDLAACRRLWEALNAHHREIYDDPAIGGGDPGHAFDEHLARVGPERIWIAQEDGEVCGLTGLIVVGEEAEIEPVVVSIARRGLGVGEKLLARAITEARALGLRFLNVSPVARNRGAIDFFSRAGFDTVGRVELFMELTPSDRRWEDGVILHGQPFRH